ncbi:MAG: FAD-dependent oxidoreductase [Bacteroidia bacterium]
MNIGVIGGGIMGLTLAHKLQEKGRSVTVYESGSQLGGLATYHDFGDFTGINFIMSFCLETIFF